MNKKNYTVQAPNATAVNLLRSWLSAVGVSVTQPATSGPDLVVRCRCGEDLPVWVKFPDDQDVVSGLRVNASDVTSRKRAEALAAFWRVTDAAGYEQRDPLQRGPLPELNEHGNPRKLHYREEPFLVSIRHTEFRRSPNPPQDRWQKYRKVIEQAAWSFLHGNYDLCARNGMSLEDVQQYLRCLVVNFVAHDEIPESLTTHCDNERKCYTYFRQRLYYDLFPVLSKKERSILPSIETASIGLYGRHDVNLEVFFEEEVDEEDELANLGPSRKLQLLLSRLPHEEMVFALHAAATSDRLDEATRAEARRHIKMHVRRCATCSAGADDVLLVEEHEETPGADALSAVE